MIKNKIKLKVGSICEQLGSVFTCLHPKYIKFCFQNVGNDREGENGRRLLLVLIMKNKF